MSALSKHAEDALQGLRRLAAGDGRPLPERHWPELTRRMRALAALGREERGHACRALDRARGEAICHLLRFAAAGEEAGLRLACLEGLLALGGFGLSAALALLEEQAVSSQEDLFDLLARQNGGRQVELVDFHRRRPRVQQGEAAEFFEELMNALDQTRPSDATAYLVESLQEAEPPAYQVGQVLLSGAFGFSARTIINAPNTASELRKTALAVAACREDELLGELGRHLSRPEPETIQDILAALRALSTPGRNLLRDVAGLLKRPEPAVRLAAFDTLARMKVSHLERFALDCLAEDPAILPGLTVRLCRLDADVLERFLDGLARRSPEAHRFVVEELVHRLSSLASDGILESLRRMIQTEGATFAAPVKPLLALRLRPHEIPPAPCPPVPPLRAVSSKRTRDAADGAARGQVVESAQRDSLFSQLTFAGGLESGVWHGVIVERCQLRDVAWSRCVFRRCRFARSDLRGARLRECSFEDCVFEDCDLDAALFELSRLANCRFTRCLGAGLLFRQSLVQTTELVQCALSGAVFMESRLACVGVSACDLSHAHLERSELAGVSLKDSNLEQARFLGGSVLGSPLAACRTRGCRVEETRSDEPVILRLAEKTLLGRLASAEAALRQRQEALWPDGLRLAEPEPGKTARPALSPSARAAQALLLTWQRRQDMRRRAAVFLADNRRRADWARERLGEVKGEVFSMIPFLIQTDALDRQAGLSNVPACRLADYVPAWDVLAAARRHAPQADLVPPGADALPVEGLYTIGSVGTVAMGQDSDLDYWVCASLSRFPPGREEALRRKLDRIEHWAAEVFDLEVHFFLMDEERIREDNFGFSDAESSGSAQARMLKEEFYRTAIRSAGRLPLWWLAPPGCDRAAYEDLLPDLGSEAAGCIDFGHLGAIPPEEYFGASLWQIVKAIKSPFKSIMKFALLERYVDEAQRGGLLCDRLKEQLLQGRREVWRIDPYAALFKDIAAYYVKIQDQEALDLVRFSFFLKVEMQRRLACFGPAARPEERSLKKLFAEQKGARSLVYKDVAPSSERLNFPERMRLGALVSQFIVNAYLRVSAKGKNAGALTIKPEDLTKLGRRISATLGRKPRKVDRFPFTSLRGGRFRALFFSVSAPRGKIHWTAHGAAPTRDGSRLETTLLRREDRLPALLAWLAVNDVYKDQTEIKCDYSMRPAASADVEQLLRRLADCFPKRVFDPELDENLKPERLTRAFFILNLTAPRNAERLVEVALVYCNNWGELYCLTDLPADPLGRLDPWRYLQKILPDKCPLPVDVDFWQPERGQGSLMPAALAD